MHPQNGVIKIQLIDREQFVDRGTFLSVTQQCRRHILLQKLFNSQAILMTISRFILRCLSCKKNLEAQLLEWKI